MSENEIKKSDYKKCDICGEWDWSNTHKCPPIMYFKHENWGEDWEEIRAHDHEDAAEKFAEMYNDDGDYSLMDLEVDVLISDGKIEKTFVVSAETSIEYFVKEKNK